MNELAAHGIDVRDDVRTAIGEDRLVRLAGLLDQVRDLRSLTHTAYTTEVLCLPRPITELDEWKRRAREDETWVFASSPDGTFIALDEVTDIGQTQPLQALIYTELHSRLTAWWLVHAWRTVDLIEEAARSLSSWRIPVAAVTTRALIEEAGCLNYQARQLLPTWADIKTSAAALTPDQQAEQARQQLHPLLVSSGFGTRIKDAHSVPQAVNVQTYVDHLARDTDNTQFRTWYDWLSDAAHPAFGAHIAFATQPLVHGTRTVLMRIHAHTPIRHEQRNPDDTLVASEPTSNEIADYSAESILHSGGLLIDGLDQALRMVDDFCLTTGSAQFTKRLIWRSFLPTRGSRKCPCGRGAWSKCEHWWGGTSVVWRPSNPSQV